MENLKTIVQGTAFLKYVKSGGIAGYEIKTHEHEYLLEIDTSDKQDVGESAKFEDYPKAIILMRWIRRALDNNTLVQIA